MRAAVRETYGDPEVVRVVEKIAVPRPGPAELVVKVHAGSVNRTDCGFRAAAPPVIRLFSGLRRPKSKTSATS